MTGLFALSGLEAVAETLRGFSEEDLDAQTELVRAALGPPRVEGAWDEIVRAAAGAVAVAPVTGSAAGTAAAGAAGKAAGKAAGTAAGTATERWRGIAEGIGALLRARPLGLQRRFDRWDLYAGRPGWALFHAALSRAGGAAAEASRDEALGLARGETGEGPPASALDRLPIGGFSGLGGIAWAMVWLAELLAAPDLLDVARSAGDRIDARRIAEDRGLDLERGAAGALLGLLALYDATGEERYLSVARRCGDHLLRHQTPTGSAAAAWPNAAGLAQTGLAHGASGIARSLLALSRAAGDDRYAVAAAAAIGHERALYDPKLRNWPVLTVDSSGRQRGRAWRIAGCRGAPGIALVRMLLPAALRDAAAEAELDAALDTTAAAPPGRLHTLCCGSFGRSAVLLEAARRGGGETRLLQAAQVVEQGLEAAAREGGFVLALDAYANRLVHPGLLHGISGIGYHLLRLGGALELPEVLSLELPSEHAGRAGAAA
jgi:lantibiotic modifying enzyme